MLISVITFLVIGYLIGCIHGSKVAQFLSGVDLKKAGFGNAGASNATLSLGWKYGVLVALIDIGKGILAIILLNIYLQSTSEFSTTDSWMLLYIIGTGVIIGHNFPFYMHFKGGKGTASIIGISLVLDWKMGLVALSLFVILSLVTNYLVIGVAVFYVTFCISTILWIPGIWPALLTLLLTTMAIVLHTENIKRLLTREEPTISSAFRKK